MDHTTTIITRTRRRLKYLGREAGWRLGWDREFFRKARGARILAYHGVCIGDPFRFNTLFLCRKAFEEQLLFYKEYFHIVSLDDFYAGNLHPEKFSICLTFDDGFANNYTQVLPLLEKYRVPATFFITGIRDAGYDMLWNDFLCNAYRYGPPHFMFRGEGYVKGADGRYVSVNTGSLLADELRATAFEEKQELMSIVGSYRREEEKEYWQQMTVEQIRELSESPWATIGSHGYYHNDLGKIANPLVHAELQASKDFLESVTGKEVRSIAFPYGSYTREAMRLAKETGYTQLLATDFLFPEDSAEPAMSERLTINPFISVINQMHANVKGNYD